MLRDQIKAFAGHTAVHVGFAFLAMGGWAVFANRAHPMPEPLLAGLVQGALSATITLLMKRALEALHARFSGAGQRVAALVAPPMIVCSISLAGLVGAHWLAQTPEILHTIAVPFSVAFTYAWVYTFGLWRHERAKA